MVKKLLLSLLVWIITTMTSSALADFTKPKLVPQLGHTQDIKSIAFSPDGRFVISGGDDNTLRLWDVSTGEELRSFYGHKYMVTSVAYSPDGKFVLSGSADGTVRLWDALTGKEISQFNGGNHRVLSVTFSPDGRFLLSASGDSTICLWDISTKKEVRRFIGHKKGVSSVVFSPDGKYILSGGLDNTLRLWDVLTGKEIKQFVGYTYHVFSVAFSPDGKSVLSGGFDKNDGRNCLKLWDVSTGKEIRSFYCNKTTVFSVAFSPDGKSVLSAAFGDKVRLWDIASGKEMHNMVGKDSVAPAIFSPDGKYILSGDFGKNIRHICLRLWNLSTGKEIREFSGHGSSITSVSFAPDGQSFLFSGEGGNISYWNMAIGKEVRRFVGHKYPVLTLAFSPSGKLALSGAGDKFRPPFFSKFPIYLWDMSSGILIREFHGHNGAVETIAFSQDSKTALSGGSDHSLQLWDVATGRTIWTIHKHRSPIISVAFSPDDKLALSMDELGIVYLWDVAARNYIKKFQVSWATCSTIGRYSCSTIAFSSDGQCILLWEGHNRFRRFDIATGKEIGSFSGPNNDITVSVFSPDKKFVLFGDRNNTLQFWDVATGKKIWQFDTNMTKINSVAFSPDGRLALSGEEDGTIRIWNITTGQWLAKLYSFNDGSWAVIDPKGRFDASNDGKIKGLHWVVGDIPIELKQLKERYYEPGLLSKIMGYNKEPLRNVEVFDSVTLYPDVKLIPPSGKKLKARIKLKNQGGGIGKVQVHINGREISSDVRPRKFDSHTKQADIIIDIPKNIVIPGGHNEMTVFAFNADGYLSSRGEYIKFFDRRKKSDDHIEIYAIVCGISKYGHPSINLKYSGKDATDIAKAIEVSAKRLFGADKVHLTLLTDLEGAHGSSLPTRENIIKAFTTAQKSKINDILFVFLAGHGVMAVDDYYYLTSEARSKDLSDPVIRKQYGISSKEMAVLINNIPALKKVMIMDTCAAGGALENLKEKRHIPSEQIRILHQLKDRTGFHILAGSAADRASLEANLYGQGLLTYSILEGIRGAALRDDQFVDVEKLFWHAGKRVPELAKSIGGIQDPYKSSGVQNFDIGMLTKDDKKLVPYEAKKPLFLKTVFQLKDRPYDPIELSKLVNRELNKFSVVSRGTSKLVYVDSEGLEPPGVYNINGRYEHKGGSVKTEVYIFEGKDEKGSFSLIKKESELESLAKEIVNITVDMVGKK